MSAAPASTAPASTRPTATTLPLVDDGELRGGFSALLGELRPRPGRLGDTLRLMALVLAAVTISEVFRLPEPAVSAYVVLFVSRGERASTVKTAVVAGVAVILAVFVTIAVFMASLSEPALRVPLIAAVTFGAMFFSRISPLGPAAFAAGFIVAYGLTLGDQVLGLSLQSAEVSNTVGPGVPELLSIPPEEALLHFLLWLAVVVAMPVCLVVLANLLTGRRPVLLLRTALADRLAACARVCAGERGAEGALTAAARAGTVELTKLLELAALKPDPAQRQPDYPSLIRETELLALALLAWPRIATPEERRVALQPCAEGIWAAERSVRDGTTPERLSLQAPAATNAAAQPLAAEVVRASQAIFVALSPRAMAAELMPPHAAGQLISAAAARDPESIRFALKVTLVVMLSYAAESLLDWPAIHTCVVTCFFVSLGTIGESVHKATLRVTGALIGGALGIATILLVMPFMTDLGDLLLALAAVTLLAGWVATGSERISYAGWQIGLAYYLAMLQGYGPTLDMQTARDRVIGIVLGNLIVLVVFTTLWPVSLARSVRRQVTIAIEQLAKLMRLDADAGRALRPLQIGFGVATNKARGLMASIHYERGIAPVTGRPIDRGTIAELEAVMVVVTVILNLRSDPVWAAAPEAARRAVRSYHTAMADWFDRCAHWVSTGAGGQTLDATIPPPPDFADAPGLAASSAWYRLLDADLRTIMGQVMQRARLPQTGGLPNG
jgi:multidrug resistance protein MdtO